MKSNILFTITLQLILFCSCNFNEENKKIDIEPYLKDYRTWWNYHYNNINLSENYIALDTSSNEIKKEVFLKLLCTGNFVPVRLKTNDSSAKYQLFKLKPNVDESITTTIKQVGADEYELYKQEGKEIPDFNFVDLNGKAYNRENTKGKVVVIKCWFIGCLACVAEMPAVNDIMKHFQNRNDIIFISLASDSKKDLEKFLTKIKFDYAVIPEQRLYMREKLNLRSYPTQFIINRKGKIAKVIIDYHGMISTLENELSK